MLEISTNHLNRYLVSYTADKIAIDSGPLTAFKKKKIRIADETKDPLESNLLIAKVRKEYRQ